MLIVKFYDDVGRPLDPDNMAWPVIKCFLEQWKALMERKKAENGTPPKISKNQAVHKWIDAFDVSQFSVRYKYLLWARPAKARR
jgi:hypothetical protein